MLTARGIDCDHGGQYKDPDTKKFREFDIRFRLTRGVITVAAAVECKAIGDNFPLLVSTIPRSNREAYHQVFFHEPRDRPLLAGAGGVEGTAVSISRLYPAGDPVGKSTAQVGRHDPSGRIHANDAEFFEKWSQALQSIDDLVDEIGDPDEIEKIWNGRAHASLALPIVVIPDGRLWSVGYDHDGQMIEPPHQVNRRSIYIGRSYWNAFPGSSIELSHLEVMTETGLAEFYDRFLSDEVRMRDLVLPVEDGAA